jgi:hypothetical protein
MLWQGSITPSSWMPDNHKYSTKNYTLNFNAPNNKQFARAAYRGMLLGAFTEDQVKRMMFDVKPLSNEA